MIKEFQYTFQDMQITPTDIAELLGFNINSIPDPFPKVIESALKQASDLCQICAGFKYFDQIEFDFTEQKILVDSQTFSPGENAFTKLKNSSAIALYVGTAGENISTYSKQLADSGNELLSYVLDVIGSLVADKTQEKVNCELENETLKSGLKTSDHFSPGHCEWNISEQKNLFSLLPENFCGVTLSESLLMSPVKSVSGIIGVGQSLKQTGNQCNWCNDSSCLYGRIKRQKKN